MTIGNLLCNWWKWVSHSFCRNYKIHPIFSSSFIQSWYCQDWDFSRWIKEVEMLQKIGIREIILQSVANTKTHYTVYPTKLRGYSHNTVDMIRAVLNAAESVEMKVRIGLGSNDDWWSLSALNQEWLNREADANSAIATEIQSLYGEHSAFGGWYIPHEFHPLLALGLNEQMNLNQFFKKIARTIKSKSTKSIMVAPFYNARLSGPVSLLLWSNIVKTTFKDTGVDILALQDSIGAEFNTLEDLDELYAYTKRAIDEIGLRLYTVTETFESSSEGNRSAPLGKIRKQMVRVSPYVSEFVAFSINHYQNGNEPLQRKGYEEYLRYYLKQRSF